MGLDFTKVSRGINNETNETELNKDDLRALKKNASGCNDPTAYEAIINVMLEQREQKEKDRFNKLLKVIFEICELSDFHVEERIVVKDMRTGKIWR